MPATDALQPPMTPAERAVIRSYGGWTSFMQSLGLRAWDIDDIAEAKRIVEEFAAQTNAYY